MIMAFTEDEGWRLFVNFIQEYFSFEYPELPKKYKDEIIKEVLLNNSKYITAEDVMSEDFCDKCGKCCRDIHCPYFDYETNLCPRHDNQLMDLCRTYPYSGEFGIQPLTLSCRYQSRFFINLFDKMFAKVIELKEGKND